MKFKIFAAILILAVLSLGLLVGNAIRNNATDNTEQVYQ